MRNKESELSKRESLAICIPAYNAIPETLYFNQSAKLSFPLVFIEQEKLLSRKIK